MDGIIDVRLVRAGASVRLEELPSDVQAAVQAYLAAAATFTPGAESTLVVELPQLAIAAALLAALGLPTLQDLFDRALLQDAPREPAVAVLPARRRTKPA